MFKWQLKEISSGKVIEEHDVLPNDWGPIFGLNGFVEKIHNLDWIGYPDTGWFQVELPDPVPTIKELTDIQQQRIQDILMNTLEMVAADNTGVTKGERAEWINYRQKIREVPLQSGFPYDMIWPEVPRSKK